MERKDSNMDMNRRKFLTRAAVVGTATPLMLRNTEGATTASLPEEIVRRPSALAKNCYSPMVRTTEFSGRVLLDDSLSSCASISSYFGTVVSSPFGTMCTTL